MIPDPKTQKVPTILKLNPCSIICPSQGSDAHPSITRRFRKDFGDIPELAQSIKKRGQIHPIVVTKTDEGYLLVAGERRLRACIFGQMTIDAILKEELTDFQAKILELEENTRRKDIDWEEQCEAVRQIHELMIKEKGHSYKDEDGGWNLKKTANYLGISIGTAQQDVSLAQRLQDHPELRAKVQRLNKVSARKYVKQVLEARVLEKSLEKRGIDIGDIKLTNINCIEGIKQLESNSIHCLITDPPFALDKIVKIGGGDNKGKDAAPLQYNVTETNVSDELTLWNTYENLIPELKRVLVDGAHFYIFLGFGWYCRLVEMLRKNGFIVDDQPLIWNKCRTTIPARGAHYMSSYEAILFGHKPPQDRVLFRSKPNVLSIPALPTNNRVHPMQKPFELLKIFIENSSSPGETVLDCFAGSGSTLLAAHQLQRNSVGFELDKGNYLRAMEWFRMENQKNE